MNFRRFWRNHFHDINKEMLCGLRNQHSLQYRTKDIATGIHLFFKKLNILSSFYNCKINVVTLTL